MGKNRKRIYFPVRTEKNEINGEFISWLLVRLLSHVYVLGFCRLTKLFTLPRSLSFGSFFPPVLVPIYWYLIQLALNKCSTKLCFCTCYYSEFLEVRTYQKRTRQLQYTAVLDRSTANHHTEFCLRTE